MPSVRMPTLETGRRVWWLPGLSVVPTDGMETSISHAGLSLPLGLTGSLRSMRNTVPSFFPMVFDFFTF